MTHVNQPDDVPEENLYAVPDDADQAAEKSSVAAYVANRDESKSGSREPGPLAILTSIMLAATVSVPVWIATCVVGGHGLFWGGGYNSILPGLFVVPFIALAISIVSFFLLIRGVLVIAQIFSTCLPYLN
jgi:hypothetical protein